MSRSSSRHLQETGYLFLKWLKGGGQFQFKRLLTLTSSNHQTNFSAVREAELAGRYLTLTARLEKAEKVTLGAMLGKPFSIGTNGVTVWY